MITHKKEVKENLKGDNTVSLKLVLGKSAEQIIGIKTSRVYSQIARTSRNPKKNVERALLISALEEASVIVKTNGKPIRKDPLYVPMKVEDVLMCFGKQLDKLPASSIIRMD